MVMRALPTPERPEMPCAEPETAKMRMGEAPALDVALDAPAAPLATDACADKLETLDASPLARICPCVVTAPETPETPSESP